MKNKYFLGDLSFGDTFSTENLGKFMVFEKKELCVVVCSVGGIGVNMQYNNALISTYEGSNIDNYCNKELLSKFEKEFGKENILEHLYSHTDATVSEGLVQKESIFKVRLIGLGEYRKYQETTNNVLKNDIWLNSTNNNMESFYMSKYGKLNSDKVYNCKDIMVICHLSNSTIVEKVKG